MELLDGAHQQLLEWDINGRKCAGTPDVFTEDRVVELKTARTADPNRFVWDARKLAYHAQIPWYQNGLLQSGVASPRRGHIVAVESVPPFPVTCFELTERALDQGERTWRLWFERLMACEQSNQWPEYCQGLASFDLPESDDFTPTIDGEEVTV
jgi:hypothetical protein